MTRDPPLVPAGGNASVRRFFYKDFLLSCAPMPNEDGSFQARVAITALGGGRTRSQRFLDLERCASFEEAIDRARVAAEAWVDTHG